LLDALGGVADVDDLRLVADRVVEQDVDFLVLHRVHELVEEAAQLYAARAVVVVVGLPAAPAGLLGGAGLLRFGARLLLLTRLLLRGLLLLAVGGRPGLVGLGRGGRRRGDRVLGR